MAQFLAYKLFLLIDATVLTLKNNRLLPLMIVIQNSEVINVPIKCNRNPKGKLKYKIKCWITRTPDKCKGRLKCHGGVKSFPKCMFLMPTIWSLAKSLHWFSYEVMLEPWPWKTIGFLLSSWWSRLPISIILKLTVWSLSYLQGFCTKWHYMILASPHYHVYGTPN
jgi:hypothetical protein